MCRKHTVGYDKDGKAQTALVQGVTGKDKKFTATQIGNDADGNLVDKTTGTGSYTATVSGNGVSFSRDGGKTSSMGVFVNGTDPTHIQGSGDLVGFSFKFTHSKLEANQTAAGSFTFAGTPEQAGLALQRAGFHQTVGLNTGMDEYRSSGNFWTGANSGHFNVFQINLKPWLDVPQAQGDMHFGEHNPRLSPREHLREVAAMNAPQRRINVPGWIGIACIVFMGLEMLVSKSMTVLSPALDKLGPLYWLVPLAMIVLPTVAAKRGSKWWLAATAAGAITAVDFLLHVMAE
jgi:hypothetical protein